MAKARQGVEVSEAASSEVADELVDDTIKSITDLTIAAPDFSEFREGMLAMFKAAHNVVFDLRTIKGDEAARKLRRQLVSSRTAIERRRTERNADDRASIAARISQRDEAAAKLVEIVRSLEGPLDEQIRSDEERRAAEKRVRDAAEKARSDALQQRILDISQVAINAVDLTSGEIREKIALVERVAITPDAFEEMLAAAATVKADTLAKLVQLLERAQRNEAEKAEAERNRLELARLQAAERERQAAEKLRQQQEAEERLRHEEAERQRQEQDRLDREAAAQLARRRGNDLDRFKDHTRRFVRGAAVATAHGIEKLIEQVRAIAAPEDLGDMAGLADKARDDAVEELQEALGAKRQAEEESRLASEAKERRDGLLQEIESIRQQVMIAQAGRTPYYHGGSVEETEKILEETRAWPVATEHFGDLFHMADAVKVATITGLEQYLAQLRSPPVLIDAIAVETAPAAEVAAVVAIAAPPAAEQAAEPVAEKRPDFECLQDLQCAGSALAGAAARLLKASYFSTKAASRQKVLKSIPYQEIEALGKALADFPLPGGQHYTADGILMAADGKRRVFCDVDD
jgi:hypothetical protein